ncbi:MAG TPA: hypothetical protein VFS20_04055 [Longimicrobium sp.]|nr:hypothetical protein [Longimicrobium sp.]
MPRSFAVLLVAALLYPAHAAAQQPTPPRKRAAAVARGMTPAQVREALGEPVRVRRDGELTYMEYANGCPGCAADYVVVRDCRVVDARLENPSRRMLATPVRDTSTPPADECRASASDSGALAVAPGPGADPQAPASGLSSTQTGAPANPSSSGGSGDTGVPGSAGGVPATRISPTADTVPLACEAPRAAPGDTVPERPLDGGSAGQWRQRMLLRRPVTRLVAVPAASISSPTAFGSQMGEGFAGVSYQARTRYTQESDAAAAIGIGLGDRYRYVGLEIAALSFSTIRGGGPLETGGISFKLHRAVGERSGVAVGWENAVSWGGSDAGNSPFAVVTHVFPLRDRARGSMSAVAASLGVGAGRFRSEEDVVADEGTVNVFGSVGVQVTTPLSVIADWNGQDLYAGASLAPVRHLPLVLNAGFADITGSAGDGARFVASVSVGFRWLPSNY